MLIKNKKNKLEAKFSTNLILKKIKKIISKEKKLMKKNVIAIDNIL
jgi:hypothetical protein